MRDISFCRPAAGMSGSPDPEHMAKMAASGSARQAVRRANGTVTVEEGAGPQAFSQGCGFAILQATEEADQRAQIEEVLNLAGAGECLLVPLMDGPPLAE